MLTLNRESKLKIIERHLVREVTQFYAQHQTGMPMQSLSAKYAKSCMDCGGFQDVIEALRVNSSIRIDYSANGARTVFPVDAPQGKDCFDASFL